MPSLGWADLQDLGMLHSRSNTPPTHTLPAPAVLPPRPHRFLKKTCAHMAQCAVFTLQMFIE